ncbi:TIGR03086 family metal-binding protein [Marmoricola sp. URHB0036]|uniref:TIGR03086 family metal-binding protein n=1 Tax=Marmoricola sp. URHB0036 TaxID=1298863 RepID=UPI000405EBB8|nr:TIGR03086 family metal-binding protein [Marmoricola sp. URHB0036]
MTYTNTALLPVPPDEAFALITEPERLRRWQTVSAYVDLRAGGSYRWVVVPGQVAAGTFQEIEPGKRVVFGWGWEGNEAMPPDASMVTVTVEPHGDGSKVTLSHAGLDEQQEKGHAEGWDHYLERLTTLASTGDVGQDEWAWAPEHLDPISATEAVLSVVQPVLRRLTPGDQPKPTPCSEFTAHDVGTHLLSSIEQLGAFAGATVTKPEQGGLENKVSVMTAQAVDAWRANGLDGTVAGPGGSELPASFAAGILPVELLLHGWDLAQASGQQMHLSDELVAYVRTLADTLVPGGRGTNFGPEVPAPENASPMEKLAAFAGRTPMTA